MVSFVGLLRAVNVGGTGKLAMTDLKAICEAAGFSSVRTYIASGNVVFGSGRGQPEAKAALEAGLRAYAGKPIRAILRTAHEMAGIVQRNPFPNSPPNHVMTIFLDNPPSPTDLDSVAGRGENEELRLGSREIYVRYGGGMANSKLRIPAANAGTARNMNTVAKLAAMVAEL